MDECKWAWLAGLIDGDGSITVYYAGKKWQICLSIDNTDRALLEEVARITGYGKIRPLTRRKPDKYEIVHKKRRYRWRVDSIGALESILSKVYPYLVAKKRRCELALKVIEMKRQRGVGGRFDDYSKKIRELIEEYSH